MQPNIAWKYLGLLTRQFRNFDRGYLCMMALSYEPKRTIEKWFTPRDELKPIIEWAKKQNQQKLNIYVSWALFGEKRRSIETCVASSAYVADWDASEPERVDDMEPTIVIQTSPGRLQEIYIHDPLEVNEARGKYRALTQRLGCDFVSADPVHLWRLPGLTNWPAAKKKRAPSLATWNGQVNGRVSLDVLVDDKEIARSEWPDRHEGKPIGHWVAAALRKPWPEGQRSEQFHKIVLKMAGLGWGISDIADRMKGTVFADKFGRRIIAEIERSISKSDLTPPVRGGALMPITYNPNDKEEAIHFLWYPYLPMGEVTFLDGDGGIGKTSLMLKVAYALVEGDMMPNGERIKPGHRVLYISLEADYSRVVLPMLKRLGVKQPLVDHLEDPTLTMNGDGLDRLQDLFEHRKYDLVVLDSIVDFLPEEIEMNDYKQSSHLVLKLQYIARTYKCAIVALRHNTKGAKDKLAYRGMGSMGWVKGARSQLVVRDSPDIEGQYVLAHTKHTHSKKGPALIYQFQEVDGRGVIEWVDISDMSDEDLNEKKPDGDRKTKTNECLTWLKDYLTGKGWINSALIFEQGETRSFNRRLIQRAASELKVQRDVIRDGKGTESKWRLA